MWKSNEIEFLGRNPTTNALKNQGEQSVFTHLAGDYANLLEQKKAFT